jgi:hypothetical protein
MTAQQERSHQQQPAERADAQQPEKIVRAAGMKRLRGRHRRTRSGRNRRDQQRRRRGCAQQQRVEPDRNHKSARQRDMARRDRTGNESGRSGAPHEAVFESLAGARQ